MSKRVTMRDFKMYARVRTRQMKKFLSKVSRANLERAKARRRAIEGQYWTLEVEHCYRYYHDSFKMFFARDTLIAYLDAILALVGETTKGIRKGYPAVVKKMTMVEFDSRFIGLVREALHVRFHEGRTEQEEWRKLSSALYTTKIALDASIKFVENLLSGVLPGERLGALEYYEALVFYLWGLTSWRRLTDSAVIDFIMRYGSKDLKKAYAAKHRSLLQKKKIMSERLEKTFEMFEFLHEIKGASKRDRRGKIVGRCERRE